MADIITNDTLIFFTVLLMAWIGVMTLLIYRWINQVIRNQNKMNQKIGTIMEKLYEEYDKK
jgi:DMSO reductase anchor subunit